jgi:hypothetical protein
LRHHFPFSIHRFFLPTAELLYEHHDLLRHDPGAGDLTRLQRITPRWSIMPVRIPTLTRQSQPAGVANGPRDAAAH